MDGVLCFLFSGGQDKYLHDMRLCGQEQKKMTGCRQHQAAFGGGSGVSAKDSELPHGKLTHQALTSPLLEQSLILPQIKCFRLAIAAPLGCN